MEMTSPNCHVDTRCLIWLPYRGLRSERLQDPPHWRSKITIKCILIFCRGLILVSVVLLDFGMFLRKNTFIFSAPYFPNFSCGATPTRHVSRLYYSIPCLVSAVSLFKLVSCCFPVISCHFCQNFYLFPKKFSILRCFGSASDITTLAERVWGMHLAMKAW